MKQAAGCGMHPAGRNRYRPQSEVIMRSMARSWTAVANQMDRLDAFMGVCHG
jgi:hypothetical protein